MGQDQMIEILIGYRVNVIAGDAGQIIQLARYISTLSEARKRHLSVSKALYTSEPMTPAQRRFLNTVFPNIAVSSAIGSAEAGPWGASPAELAPTTKEQNYADFVYDQRLMHLEVFPFAVGDPHASDSIDARPLPDGEKGLLVQTSLQRLRHPLVRYVCGDVCSLHPLPDSIRGRFSPEDALHYKVARIYGRDRRISFDWDGEYFEFPVVEAAMRTESWGILQYQIIRRYNQGDEDHVDIVLELRVLRCNDQGTITEEELTQKLRELFYVLETNQELFDLKYLSDFSGFVRSTTGQKVIHFIDRTQDGISQP